ncbi:hypothetical protein DVH26_19995 [Paenibacillus sp. H1-7]|uniref:DUF7674 family protein n=1 Tax=Paenibacillus sp. H1-7 TaxID=2282849 RepID=UPI001EF82188|nr:hypothetical protein [Paenibacillus sp. H1-7]ULL16521.1 hypothetical protein DVH26_19995 [Paenibacillus sp. H1-7]
MSVWRRKATELFNIRFGPTQHETIYDVFRTLLGLVKEAHNRGDEDQLKKIYEYAEWCSTQRADDLRNAAGVSFYEHLVDDEVTYQAILRWIKPTIFSIIKDLLKWRIKDETVYRDLVDKFNVINGTSIQY